jgi:hypothetical protein
LFPFFWRFEMKKFLRALLGLCVLGLFFVGFAAVVSGGAANDDDPEDRLCPNPYDPITGEFTGFSDYPVGPSRTVDFPAKLDKDGFIGPNETPIDLDGDGTPALPTWNSSHPRRSLAPEAPSIAAWSSSSSAAVTATPPAATRISSC